MKTMHQAGCTVVVIAALLAALTSPHAADKQSKHDELVKKDLFAVITLQGHHCGKVLTFERQKQHDYLANCENGKSFRIYVVPEGRVAIDER